MFPIFILDGKTELPKEGTFYVLAQDGLYLSKETGLIRAMVKVEKISFLKKLEAKVELRLPKIPSEMIAKSLLFFRRVFETHHSEAAVLLYYSREQNVYVVDVPKQRVGAAIVDYEIQGQYDKGFNLVGTIHSHCDFEAFHSGIDVHDERDFDGIHITIGRIDQAYFTISCSVVVNNNRFDIEAERFVHGIEKVDFVPELTIDHRRLLGIKQDPLYSDAYQREGWLNKALCDGIDCLSGAGHYQAPKQQFYDLVLPEGRDYRNYPFPKEWFERVIVYKSCLSIRKGISLMGAGARIGDQALPAQVPRTKEV